MEMREALRLTAKWYGQTWRSRQAAAARLAPLQHELVRRAGVRVGTRVIDFGTGTGVTSFVAAIATGPGGFVVGIDNAEELMHVARGDAAQRGLTNAAFGVIDMTCLPFPDATFDHAISSFAIYGAYPPGGGIGEAFRVLRPGGTLTFNMVGRILEGVDSFGLVQAVVDRHTSDDGPFLTGQLDEAFRLAPWGLCRTGPLSEPADPMDVVDFLRDLGFVDVEATVTYERIVSTDVRGAVDYFLGGRLDVDELPEERRHQVRRECAAALEPARTEEGFVLLGHHVLYLSATKPTGAAGPHGTTAA